MNLSGPCPVSQPRPRRFVATHTNNGSKNTPTLPFYFPTTDILPHPSIPCKQGQSSTSRATAFFQQTPVRHTTSHSHLSPSLRRLNNAMGDGRKEHDSGGSTSMEALNTQLAAHGYCKRPLRLDKLSSSEQAQVATVIYELLGASVVSVAWRGRGVV